MINLKSAITALIYQVGGVILIYFLCRIFFLIFNYQEFSIQSILDVLALLIYGIRFDLSAVFLTNAVFVLLGLLPFKFTLQKYFRNTKKALFLAVNSLFILLNCADIAYFPFVHKRMAADVLLFVTGEKGNDFARMLPSFILEHWYLLFLYVFLIFLLTSIYNKADAKLKSADASTKKFSLSFLSIVLAGGIVVLSIRGGLQKKPLNIIHASEMADVSNMAVLLNTPFTVIKTLKKKALHEVHYFSEQQLNNCDKGIHLPNSKYHFKKQNVVVVIVESLSRNYMSYFKGTGKTPFLDSLFSQSLVFENGFANAKESIQGIPAILASIPSLQEDAFIFSNYSSNKITSFANLLKPEGYKTYFFHGGDNGTMGFNSFSRLSGFDYYYGRDEYSNDADYDGKWGIWDEPFLQRMGKELSNVQQPFFASVFTLNTHHPFAVPAKYQQQFKQDGHPILPCVQYADYALKRFFESNKDKAWFKNTLFVITADHTGPKIDEMNIDVLNDYRIPIAFYKSDGSLKRVDNRIANQIDILPSVMHLLGYSKPFFSQGKNLLTDGCQNFAVNYRSGVYQYIDSTYCYQFDGQKRLGFYNWRADKAFANNLDNNKLSREIDNSEKSLKRFIQVFNGSMINNRMVYNPNQMPANKKFAQLNKFDAKQ